MITFLPQFRNPVLFLTVLAVASCKLELPQGPLPKPKTACQLQIEGLEESSGVAPSLLEPGWYYTHNDDDEPMRYWKFDLNGKSQGPYLMPGIKNRDVEDMATARIQGKNFLYFADIGDNQARYESTKIYRVEEPKGSAGEQRSVSIFTISYPKQAMNAEAFFVNPKTGDFWVIEKTSVKPARIFWCKAPAPGDNHWEEVGTISLGGAIAATKLITGAAIAQDSSKLIVRTYLAAYEFEIAGKLDQWWKLIPKQLTLNIEGQGEAITYSLDGKTVVTTSEGKPCQVSIATSQLR